MYASIKQITLYNITVSYTKKEDGFDDFKEEIIIKTPDNSISITLILHNQVFHWQRCVDVQWEYGK